MTETKTQETNRTVQTQPIAIKMHYICDSDYVSKINKYAAILNCGYDGSICTYRYTFLPEH